MKLKTIITLLICACQFTVFAQKKEKTVEKVEVSTKRVGETYVVSAKNNTTERQEMTLNIAGTGFAKVKSPMTKLINKGETIEFLVLKQLKGQVITPDLNYTYLPKPTEEEISIKNNKLQKKAVKGKIDFSKGIIVFAQDGCPRCNRTTSYLIDNNIDFKYINVTTDAEMNTLMFDKLKENGVLLQTVRMPVMFVNGKISYSHKDLEGFLEALGQKG